ncbi:MAG: PilZ domain-containing protein [Armatimonadetes bacterium]|nr:PilZ domain-containing protein [Armatimonadota bacterium]
MSKIGLESFAGSRCRLSRLSDGKKFAGWVEQFTGARLAVVSETSFDLAEGEAVYVELFGDYVTACMTVDVTACGPADEALDSIFHMELLHGQPTAQRTEGTVTSRIRVVDSAESRRRVVPNWNVAVTLADGQTQGTVHDVSACGLGIDVEGPIEAGSEVELEVQTPLGEVKCQGKVRYCRELPNGDGTYRCGVNVDYLSRVDYARWAQITHEAA